MADHPVGYPDWQRVSDWDGPVVWQFSGNVPAGGTISPVLDVSRWGSVGGVITLANNPVVVEVEWYVESERINSLGSFTLIADSNLGNIMPIRLPNRGPWATISLFPVTGSVPTVTTNIFGTNRQTSGVVFPRAGVLIRQDAAQINPGAQLEYYPVGYWSGPIVVWANSAAALYFSLTVEDAGAGWDTVAQIGAAAGSFVQAMAAPAGAWRFVVTNSGAAVATFYLGVTASLAGPA